MKKILCILCSLLLAIPSILAQSDAIPNGSFENWTTTTYSNLWLTGYPATSNLSSLVAANDTTVMPTTDAYHGTYALKIRTIITGSKTYNGHVVNVTNANSSSPSGWVGGTPYTQTPTGMRAYYKYYNPNYTAATGDSATIIVAFKKGGNIIQTYAYLIGGWQKSTYALFQQTFSPALTTTPDSVMIGFTSSDAMHSQYAVNGSVLKIDSVSFTGATSQPAINGDFENWTSYTTNPIPNDWNCSDYQNNLIYRTTDSYSGYAIAIKSGYDSNKAQAYGSGISISLYTDSGFPCPTKDSLVFYYKYAPAVSTELAFAQINLYKSGNNTGFAYLTLPQQSTYKRQAFYFNATNNVQPDSIQINFGSADYNNTTTYSAASYAGSTLYIDGVDFKSDITTGINSPIATSTIRLYPNPLANYSVIDIAQDVDLTGLLLYVYDVTGKIVQYQQITSHQTNLYKSDFAPGLYYYKLIQSNSAVKTDKFIVE